MRQDSTKVLTAHVPLSLADRVDFMAEKLERSRGWVIKQALANWIAQEEEKTTLTLEALADVEQGKLVSHQAVLQWAESLAEDQPLELPK